MKYTVEITDVAFEAIREQARYIAISVYPCVNRILQKTQQCMVARLFPGNLPRVFSADVRRKLDLLLAQPHIQLAHAGQFAKLAKHQIQCGMHALIGIFLNPIALHAYVPDRHTLEQLTPSGFLLQRSLCALAKAR